MEDITEYGNDGHLEWCKTCGADAFVDGEDFNSCPFKNIDEVDEWQDGWLKQRFYHTNHSEP